jgi:hypothetical protein
MSIKSLISIFIAIILGFSLNYLGKFFPNLSNLNKKSDMNNFKTPNCSNNETISLLRNLLKKRLNYVKNDNEALRIYTNIIQSTAGIKPNVKYWTLHLDYTITVNYNPIIDKYVCLAHILYVNRKTGKLEYLENIKYTVQKTDDRTRFLVNLESPPRCSDPEVIKLLVDLLKEKEKTLKKSLGDVRLDLTSVDTLDYNPRIKKYICEADVSIIDAENDKLEYSTKLKYSVRQADYGDYIFVKLEGNL